MATYEILINLQQLFDQLGVQHGVPAAAGMVKNSRVK